MAAGLAWPTNGLRAQIASAPVQGLSDNITTVEPLTVSPLAPVPDVGPGATYFFPDELTARAREARQAYLDAKADARQCGMAGTGPSAEVFGEFGTGPLMDSVRVAEYDRQRTAEAAARATTAALSARMTAARGETSALATSELVRQRAVLAYQKADADALEAHRRVADFQDLRASDSGAGRSMLKAMVDNRSYEREHNQGVTGVYIPDAFKDLRLTEITARQTEDNGAPAIRISGKIVNTRKAPISVPPLWISVVDKFGTSLKSEQTEPPRGVARIPAGGMRSFNYVVKAVPQRTARTVVTFAPFHRLPTEEPVGFYCR
ncbi:MAG: hypothetical protein WCI21_01465 [Alphaproteobacteria bacterium]